MADLIKGKATICIANYKTLELTRLCLRSIRKFTHYPYEVIVVDNGSADESLDYLRSLRWIRLIERDSSKDSSGGYSHGAALDLGLENCNTEFFAAMHSDTFIIKDNWLSDLINFFDGEDFACVGSGKVELTPQWRILLKKATDFRTFKRKLLREPDPVGIHRYYNRTICSIYRTAILKKENLSFLIGREKRLTVGKKLYFELVDKGYKTVELPDSFMRQYLYHLAHATQVINPHEFTLRKRTRKKCSKLISKIMSLGLITEMLEDVSLDK
jgi:glycosyltransferase involved in cell wall biosynthesis